ncbi:MAG: Stp1/IreP family PP2C-type Ser/Thr phosphatase [Deltaproteobacteria bacterium]|nr:Stp1/IreP family PP2C-type Ser/Thr phosphatase [Deltaproteobacteria bacterium]
MRIEFAGDTHVGQKRDTNQDALLLLPEEDLFVVADGMGGHLSGEVASSMATSIMKDFFVDSGEDVEITWPFRVGGELGYHANRLAVAVKLANLRIFETAQSNRQYKSMGTTVVGAYLAEGELYVAHVGDSRAYRLRGGAFERLTEDHSLLNDFKKHIRMSPEDEERFPYKNIIVRALGMKDTVDVDLRRMRPVPGDVFLLCSDGLTGEVPDAEIRRVLLEEQNLTRACARLIGMANDAGGKDNITVVALRILSDGGSGLALLDREITTELNRDLPSTDELLVAADAIDALEVTRDLKVDLDADLEEIAGDLETGGRRDDETL